MNSPKCNRIIQLLFDCDSMESPWATISEREMKARFNRVVSLIPMMIADTSYERSVEERALIAAYNVLHNQKYDPLLYAESPSEFNWNNLLKFVGYMLMVPHADAFVCQCLCKAVYICGKCISEYDLCYMNQFNDTLKILIRMGYIYFVGLFVVKYPEARKLYARTQVEYPISGRFIVYASFEPHLEHANDVYHHIKEQYQTCVFTWLLVAKQHSIRKYISQDIAQLIARIVWEARFDTFIQSE